MKLPCIASVLALSLFTTPPLLGRDGDSPRLPTVASDVARTAGIGQLESTLLPDGASELRVWVGFGVVSPEHLLRLVVRRDGVITGESIVYFPTDISYMEDYEAEFRRELLAGCTNLRQGKKVSVCTSTFTDSPDWQTLYGDLVDLGILSLPDESELPDPEFQVMDGIAMVVEVRNGSDYRAYRYSNPSFRNEPQAQRASQIIHTVVNLVSREDGT
jgi:hypothetical protein